MLPNLEAADEAMPSQQLKNNGPQSVVISRPVQGEDIEAPDVQVLWKSNGLGRKAPLQISLEMARSVGLLGVLPSEARKQSGYVGLFQPRCLSTRKTRRQGFASWVSKNCSVEHRNSSLKKKITPRTEYLLVPMVISTPNLLLFPQNPGGHLETVVDCSRIRGTHSGIRSPEHPEKEHGEIRDSPGRRNLATGAAGISLRVGRVMKDQAGWDRGNNRGRAG